MVEIETIILSYVLPISVGLSSLSIIIFVGVILYRYYYDRSERRKAVRQEEIKKQFLVHLVTPLNDLSGLVLQDEEDRTLVAEVAITLLRTLKGDSRTRLIEALFAMGFYEETLQNLKSTNVTTLIAATKLSIFWSDEKTKEAVVALLKNRSYYVRLSALEALAKTRDLMFLPVVIKAFKEETGLSTLLMKDILQTFGTDRGDVLLPYLEKTTLPLRVKIAIIMALEEKGNKQVVDAIAPFCNHKNVDVRRAAYAALSKSGYEIPSELLQKGAADTDWNVRISVVECAMHSEPLPVSLMEQLFDDKNWFVSLRAGRAFYESGEIGKSLLESIAASGRYASTRAQVILSEFTSSQRGREL